MQPIKRSSLFVLLILYNVLSVQSQAKFWSKVLDPKAYQLGTKFEDFSTPAFLNRCLKRHNDLRAVHGGPSMTIDSKVSEFAKARAKVLAETERLVHDSRDYGENLAWNSGRSRPFDCALVVDLWYSEDSNYDYDSLIPNVLMAGHFTQVVWKASVRLGCGQAGSLGPKGGVYTVCHYDPPGNILGQFGDNVARPQEGRTPPPSDVDPDGVPDYDLQSATTESRVIGFIMIGILVAGLLCLAYVLFASDKKASSKGLKGSKDVEKNKCPKNPNVVRSNSDALLPMKTGVGEVVSSIPTNSVGKTGKKAIKEPKSESLETSHNDFL